MAGMDMLIKSIVQAAGIDPEKVKGEIQEYGRQLAVKIQSMDNSLMELKKQQDAIYNMLLQLALKDRKPGEAAPIAQPIAPNGEASRV